MTDTKRKPSPAKRPSPKKRQSGRGGLFVGMALIAVVAIVVVFVLVSRSNSSNSTASNSGSSQLAPPSLVAAVTGIPSSTLTSIGYNSKLVPPPSVIKSQPALVQGGKPEILYMGAEYCPYCAAMRWPMVVALSRFGTFSKLGLTHSSTSDVYPGTNTFTFYGSTYSSKYISFSSVEETTNTLVNGNYPTLQIPTKAQQNLINKFDIPPYSSTAQGIPFIDFSNHYVISGASYNPQILSGLTWDAIAGSLSNPATLPAQGIGETANMITGTICKLTNNQPGSVCSTPLMTKIEKTIGG
ncbi:MAG: DUF929 family protein [Acidimicrobiaceae bacterium]|nr:DUF929 family protein [Acidimicrobiaceae bacterium]